jgi:hypothetical protein
MKQHDPEQAWKCIRLVQEEVSSHHKEPRIMKMKLLNGKTAMNDKENANVFEPHFKTFINHVRLVDESIILESPQQQEIDETLAFPPLRGEVLEVIQKMENRKAPGKNGIPQKHSKPLKVICWTFCLNF